MSKSHKPPKSANTVTKQLRWYLRNSGTPPTQIARAAGVHHAVVFKFLSEDRGMSVNSLDALAKVLNLRLVQEKK